MIKRRAPRPIVIDTDPGIDDALAIVLALRSPELQVELVTTVAGNTGLRAATDNARRMLALLDPDDPPRLVPGAARPTERFADVVVVGSANTDLTVTARALPRPGETVTEGALHTGFGGKGANQAVAARRAATAWPRR